MGEKKKFSMLSCILTVICVVFVAEAAAPVAAIGNSQYFWWIFMIVLFLLPYGLISSEMGTTYDNGGGLMTGYLRHTVTGWAQEYPGTTGSISRCGQHHLRLCFRTCIQ